MEKLKEDIIKEIKELIKTNKEEDIFINPNYLNYFNIEELEDIKNTLENRKKEFDKTNSDYLDEIYNKTKKDKI
ncbi:hypothetical protein ACNSOS_00875 [Aliarcobacter vitoriensis]|uniref:Uncharacterized protein n=1 Tax=Aliarcobacter vitoriensis TaxID=2011099 RepID=A0A366MUQ0_9BACT|nr:hypothetical protein [Aliarcobacter vitoriensis]RBQ29981.1 hypothetical protein CRU91_01490 [Aliarcobacter vitoriensis]RBQ31984.1 hypothetical protein CRU92_04230 [Arcobacter sp. FW59]